MIFCKFSKILISYTFNEKKKLEFYFIKKIDDYSRIIPIFSSKKIG